MKLTASLSMLPVVLGLITGCEDNNNPQRVVGQLESDRIELTVDYPEPIVEIPVEEGQTVSAGDLLVVQDDSRIAAQVQETEALLAQTRARLDELIRGPRGEQIDGARASAEGAERELAFRKTEYRRAQRLFEQKLGTREQVDRTRAAVDAAVANLELQQSRLEELLAGTTVEELRQAENAVRQREAQLAVQQVNLEKHRILAPVDGLVDSILFEPGERPSPDKPVIILLSGEQAYARIYIPESLRASVAPGTPATVHVDGLEQSFKGRVRWVSSEAAFTPYFALTERDRGRLSYFAKVDILDSDLRLPDGVPVEVVIQSGDTAE